MWKLLKKFIAFWVVSFFFFPVLFRFLPLNTKTIMAALGVVACAYALMRSRAQVPKNLFPLLILAGVVSLFGVLSMTINNTSDSAYSGYLMSAVVWLSAAYLTCCVVKWAHGYITVDLICKYMIAVSIMQCASALIIDRYPAFQVMFDRYVDMNQYFLHAVKRLYGFGASLDVAGMRFASCLIMIIALIVKERRTMSMLGFMYYVFAFAVITVVGSMVARTTYVGVVLAIFYFIFSAQMSVVVTARTVRMLSSLLAVLVLVIGLCVVMYNTDDGFRRLTRFAFEGFFNLFEYGEYSMGTTDTLRSMYVFPDNTKTWIIGDGYFSNPYWLDVTYTYIDQNIEGYYKGTDVGYLRFIFYFGVLGLSAFSIFMIQSARTCIQECRESKLLFISIAIANFVVWFKVASDLFLIFALFICVVNMGSDEESSDSLEEVPA